MADANCTLNEWFLSLPEGRQKVLREDKWMLAEAAFEAGKELAQKAEQQKSKTNPLQEALIPLREELSTLEAQFEGQGGRGVEIADRIDYLRGVLDYVDRGERLIVPAECHSDDFAIEVRFDAAFYLFQHPETVQELIECSWGGDYPGDYVAEFTADYDPEIQAMFTYIRAANRVPSRSLGFECHLDEEAARIWIGLVHPHIDLPE